MKYYIIINGRLNNKTKRAIITDKKRVALKSSKRSESSLHTFDDVESALLYVESIYGVDCIPRRVLLNDEKVDISKSKICPICDKPHALKTQLCRKCHINKRHYKASIAKLVFLRSEYKIIDIWLFLEKNPDAVKWPDKEGKGILKKREIVSTNKSYKYQLSNYKKWEAMKPQYIDEMFKKYPLREYITMSGSIRYPNVHYLCNACKEEYSSTVDSFQKGHNCTATKSSGEIIIEEFLKKKYEIKTQFDTLKCINPITGRQLPYDIEVPHLKLIIEIHGEQHYKYVEYFHRTYENFQYQILKDDIKESFAKDCGYSFLSINYDDIRDGSYVMKIEHKISVIDIA